MPLGASFFEDVPLVEFMHLVFIFHARWSYRRRLRSLLLCPFLSSARPHSIHEGQEVFAWSDRLLDLGTDFFVGNMVFV